MPRAVGRVRPLCLLASALLLALPALAGCAQPGSSYAGAPAPSSAAVRHDLASNSPIAVTAGKVFRHPFSLTTAASIPVTYEFRVRDDSSVDIGFVRASDVAEYEQGQTVSTWGYQANTQGTQQTANLPTGEFALVIHCRNAFADCDLNYSLSAYY